MKFTPKRVLLTRLAALYDKMAKAYATSSPEGFTCEGCQQNCCVSHFQHHTYIEWRYLWEGLAALPEATRDLYVERARENVLRTQEALSRGETPTVMCPVNDDGRCGIYQHRLMICRLYGVPNMFLSSSGIRQFPGCPICMDALQGRQYERMDRTPLYRDLAALEVEFLGSRRGLAPKVDLTLAEMILAGPPKP